MGAVHLLGATNYAKLIRDNNAFIHSMVMIPLGNFQHETLDILFSLDLLMDINKTTLLELIAEQTWCLSIEKTMTINKVLITMTKAQLDMARKWIDSTLPTIYSQFIADKIDVMTLRHFAPWHLNNPILTVASTMYMDQLKRCTNNINTVAAETKQYVKPPCPKNARRLTLYSTIRISPTRNSTLKYHSSTNQCYYGSTTCGSINNDHNHQTI